MVVRTRDDCDAVVSAVCAAFAAAISRASSVMGRGV